MLCFDWWIASLINLASASSDMQQFIYPCCLNSSEEDTIPSFRVTTRICASFSCISIKYFARKMFKFCLFWLLLKKSSEKLVGKFIIRNVCPFRPSLIPNPLFQTSFQIPIPNNVTSFTTFCLGSCEWMYFEDCYVRCRFQYALELLIYYHDKLFCWLFDLMVLFTGTFVRINRISGISLIFADISSLKDILALLTAVKLAVSNGNGFSSADTTRLISSLNLLRNAWLSS